MTELSTSHIKKQRSSATAEKQRVTNKTLRIT